MYELPWFKTETNIFSNRKIQLILKLTDGDTYFRVWIQLIALAVECNNKGRLEIGDNNPMTIENFSKIMGKSKKKIEKINNLFNGIIEKNDFFSPTYINIENPKYIEIDNIFYSGLIIVNYYKEQTEIILKNLIETNMNMNISIFYEKQDSYKAIKDLTYHIGNARGKRWEFFSVRTIITADKRSTLFRSFAKLNAA